VDTLGGVLTTRRGRIAALCALVAVATVACLPAVPMWVQLGARLGTLVGVGLMLAPWAERTRARLRKGRRI
jgi:hypothetical protein